MMKSVQTQVLEGTRIFSGTGQNLEVENLDLALQALEKHKQKCRWACEAHTCRGSCQETAAAGFLLAALNVFSRLPVALTSEFLTVFPLDSRRDAERLPEAEGADDLGRPRLVSEW